MFQKGAKCSFEQFQNLLCQWAVQLGFFLGCSVVDIWLQFIDDRSHGVSFLNLSCKSLYSVVMGSHINTVFVLYLELLLVCPFLNGGPILFPMFDLKFIFFIQACLIYSNILLFKQLLLPFISSCLVVFIWTCLLQSMVNCCWQSSKYAIILLFIGMPWLHY